MDSLPRSRSLRRLYSTSDVNGAAAAGASTSTGATSAGTTSTSRGGPIPSTSSNLHPALIPKYRKPGQNLTDAASASEYNSRKYVWVPDDKEAYVSGWITKEQDGIAEVACVDDKTRSVPAEELSKMNPPKFDRVEDIADLTFLNEASVVHNLKERYTSEMIYTYSGPFLVAVNPYRSLPIYGQDAVALYKARRKEELPPHVFAVAERAWQNMVGEREGQSILVTGESGAGKTENTKKVIQYLTAIAAEASRALPPSGSASSIDDIDDQTHRNTLLNAQAEGRKLENQIIQANPILEAFGNAQTVRNNNSSRFGKFIRIEFTQSGAIAGATIDWYLLEKSRVTARSEKERNFHVFYQLLKGAPKELKRDLLLTSAVEDFEYLKHSRPSIEGVDDHEEWRSLQHALDVVGFSPKEQFDLFRIIAAILHIGNIAVSASGPDQAVIKDNSSLEKVCHLLGLPIAEFSKALTRPQVKAGREWVTQARSKKQVEDEMGALCKTLYEKSFGALVERINRALERPVSKSTFIGVLDIAGFEIFETNGFEQLCINYTNEKLQQFFNHHMFVLEQEEYARESIDWQFVNFGLDLQPTIDLIESSQPVGILSCLDEECIMPKATDATFTEKLNQLNKQSHRNSTLQGANGSLDKATSKYTPNRLAMGFTISHYAGKVEYRTDGWLDKNRDPLNSNITSVLSCSTEKYISTLFEEYRDEEVSGGAAAAQSSAGGKRKVRKGAFRTVAQRHKEQLGSLMAQLRETQPHFVRCIVPNENKRPGQVNVPLVLDQLRCNGVLEGIRIARLGYPNRLPFVEFKQRYEVLTPGIIPKGYMDGRKACQRITEALELDKAVYRIGLNKIFFKAGILAELEEKRDELLYSIFAQLQAGCRRFIYQRRLRKQLSRDSAIRTIQRNAQIYLELKSWPWWMLYTKLRPLLAATRTDEALKRREAELLLAQERAQRDVQEKQKLEQLKLSLEADKKKIAEALESERALNIDKDGLLTRSKEREAALQEEMILMQTDLTTMDNQLERALLTQEASEKRYAELKMAFDAATEHIAKLEAESATYKAREPGLKAEVEAISAEIESLSSMNAKLSAELRAAQIRLVNKDEDTQTALRRAEEVQAKLQSKLAASVEEQGERVRKTSMLEKQVRQLQQESEDAKRSLASLRTSQSRKEDEFALLQSQIETAQRQRDDAASEAGQLRAQIDMYDKRFQDAKSEALRVGAANHQLDVELSSLKKLIAAKTSEDTKQKEIAALKEQEIVDLRQQARALSFELEATSKQNNDKLQELRVELEEAKHQVATLGAARTDAETQVQALSALLEDNEKALDTAQRSRRAAEAELDALRARQAEVQRELSKAQSQRDTLQNQVSSTVAKVQALEDRTVLAERESSSWQRESENLGDKLEKEMTKRMTLEKTVKRGQDELEAVQLQLLEQDQYIKGLRKELQERESELHKAISMQDKTIVEHVHVLEEAKRYTDKQLSETQARLASVTQYSRTLEKTKTRLQTELEDLSVQNEREKVTERTFEKQMKKLEEQAEKANKRLVQEEKMRQVAEQDVTRLTAELQRLKTSSATYPTSNGVVRSRSQFENIPPDSLGYNYASSPNDDPIRGKILRDLTEANRELEASMRATLNGVNANRTPAPR